MHKIKGIKQSSRRARQYRCGTASSPYSINIVYYIVRIDEVANINQTDNTENQDRIERAKPITCWLHTIHRRSYNLISARSTHGSDHSARVPQSNGSNNG